MACHRKTPFDALYRRQSGEKVLREDADGSSISVAKRPKRLGQGMGPEKIPDSAGSVEVLAGDIDYEFR